MQLYAKIQDREGGFERVVLCKFTDKDGDEVFIEEEVRNGEECFKLLIDEGYVKTYYFYPFRRYLITELSVYQ